MHTDGLSRLQLRSVPRTIEYRGYVNRPNLGRFNNCREASWRMDSETEKSREHCDLL